MKKGAYRPPNRFQMSVCSVPGKVGGESGGIALTTLSLQRSILALELSDALHEPSELDVLAIHDALCCRSVLADAVAHRRRKTHLAVRNVEHRRSPVALIDSLVGRRCPGVS